METAVSGIMACTKIETGVSDHNQKKILKLKKVEQQYLSTKMFFGMALLNFLTISSDRTIFHYDSNKIFRKYQKLLSH